MGGRRAIRKLSERVPFLSGLLGQQMPLLGSVDIGGFWRAHGEQEKNLRSGLLKFEEAIQVNSLVSMRVIFMIRQPRVHAKSSKGNSGFLRWW